MVVSRIECWVTASRPRVDSWRRIHRGIIPAPGYRGPIYRARVGMETCWTGSDGRVGSRGPVDAGDELSRGPTRGCSRRPLRGSGASGLGVGYGTGSLSRESIDSCGDPINVGAFLDDFAICGTPLQRYLPTLPRFKARWFLTSTLVWGWETFRWRKTRAFEIPEPNPTLRSNSRSIFYPTIQFTPANLFIL